MALMIDTFRQYCGKDWTPSRIFISSQQHTGIKKFFGTTSKFELMSGGYGVEFDTKNLAQTIPFGSSDHNINWQDVAIPKTRAETILQMLDSWSIHRSITLQSCADTLKMSVRTLQRNLKNDGENFELLIDTWRKNKALSLLLNSNLRINEISMALHYRQVQNFYRAFNRWTGTRPELFRDALD